jgi:phytoene synthase
MSQDSRQKQIFKRGSKTYYTSSLFFPPEKRKQVSVLYAFVRVADDFVDSTPQDERGFYTFGEAYRTSWHTGVSSGNLVIDDFITLQRNRGFNPDWTEAFLRSMELDLNKRIYQSLDESLEYIYGSAEVIGLFMNRILGVPPEADGYARMLGRSMQYINFIRDIDEDVALGRRYLPELPESMQSLEKQEAAAQPDRFRGYIIDQIERYRSWQAEAVKGYAYLPRRYRIPIETAADMYDWTASKIEQDPFIVYRKKVKPAKMRIILHVAGLSMHSLFTP